MAPKSYMRAHTGFAIPAPRGQSRGRVVKAGEILDADDPVVKGREALFDPLADVVEQATASPGEKRVLPTRGVLTPDDPRTAERVGRAMKAKKQVAKKQVAKKQATEPTVPPSDD